MQCKADGVEKGYILLDISYFSLSVITVCLGTKSSARYHTDGRDADVLSRGLILNRFAIGSLADDSEET